MTIHYTVQVMVCEPEEWPADGVSFFRGTEPGRRETVSIEADIKQLAMAAAERAFPGKHIVIHEIDGPRPPVADIPAG